MVALFIVQKLNPLPPKMLCVLNRGWNWLSGSAKQVYFLCHQFAFAILIFSHREGFSPANPLCFEQNLVEIGLWFKWRNRKCVKFTEWCHHKLTYFRSGDQTTDITWSCQKSSFCELKAQVSKHKWKLTEPESMSMNKQLVKLAECYHVIHCTSNTKIQSI